jgi:hypothetical protein
VLWVVQQQQQQQQQQQIVDFNSDFKADALKAKQQAVKQVFMQQQQIKQRQLQQLQQQQQQQFVGSPQLVSSPSPQLTQAPSPQQQQLSPQPDPNFALPVVSKVCQHAIFQCVELITIIFYFLMQIFLLTCRIIGTSLEHSLTLICSRH